MCNRLMNALGINNLVDVIALLNKGVFGTEDKKTEAIKGYDDQVSSHESTSSNLDANNNDGQEALKESLSTSIVQ